ncbi:helix-turn-helix transcriptional regulator [Coprobacillus sp. AF33-1AC]|uniref:helix-turn-helix transcriptional regulator n=1 Tax=Coprobacillus sp. AF33-1AC TaxID=2292032 RepID=UPI000E5495D6|nr:helix-turn-helix transcriptional regulator [Coprobacillus sp. AF33-1AC]RHM63110.1 XRE family transcriptional regulator [Coprobacillus sp. AF33-1AC]
MDTKKIGSFLKQLRIENHLTQEQLGQQIGVTNKTISRWETGNYLPPIECLILLSDFYKISINEILSGKRVLDENIKEVAEENMTQVLKEIQIENKKYKKRLIVILLMTGIIAVTILAMLPLNTLHDLIIFVLVILLAFITNILNVMALDAKIGKK